MWLPGGHSSLGTGPAFCNCKRTGHRVRKPTPRGSIRGHEGETGRNLSRSSQISSTAGRLPASTPRRQTRASVAQRSCSPLATADNSRVALQASPSGCRVLPLPAVCVLNRQPRRQTQAWPRLKVPSRHLRTICVTIRSPSRLWARWSAPRKRFHQRACGCGLVPEWRQVPLRLQKGAGSQHP